MTTTSADPRVPTADDIEPVKHETADRIATGTITVLPVHRPRHRRLAALERPAPLERRLRVRDHVPAHGTRRDGRLPPLPDPPQLQDEQAGARDARHPRVGVDRGPGDLVGGRPPQAPRLLRQGGRPAQPARRTRGRLEGRAARSRARAPGLALHPHPARLQEALCAGPREGPGDQLGGSHTSSSGRSAAWRSRSRSATRSAARSPRRSPACCGAAACACSSSTT